MLIFIGVQLLTFGLLAEVLARTYYESQDKPNYVIREVRRPRTRSVHKKSCDDRPPASSTARAKAEREHDPRITVIQQELFNESRSKGDNTASCSCRLPAWRPDPTKPR